MLDNSAAIEHLALCGLTGVATFFDLRRREIPNELTVLGATFGVGLSLGGSLGSPLEHVGAALLALFAGAFIAGGVSVPLWRAGALGGGDVKLLVASGSILGPLPTLKLLGFSLSIFVVLSLWKFQREGRLSEAWRRSWSPFRRELSLAGVDAAESEASAIARLVPFAPAMFLASIATAWL